jgi:hypothetical protein
LNTRNQRASNGSARTATEKLIWSSRLPFDSGLYWFRESDGAPIELCVVALDEEAEAEHHTRGLIKFLTGPHGGKREWSFCERILGEWAGPLRPPA